MVSTIVTELTGRVVTAGLDKDLTSSERQKELETRLIPGVPSHYQFAYLGLLAIGVIGWPVARLWWGLLWPPQRRDGYRSVIRFYSTRVARFIIFLLLFLPVVAVPGALVTLALQLWAIVTWPFRMLRALFRRFATSGA